MLRGGTSVPPWTTSPKDTDPGLPPRHECRPTSAGPRLPGHVCRAAFAGPRLPGHVRGSRSAGRVCRATFAAPRSGPRLPRHVCRATFSATRGCGCVEITDIPRSCKESVFSTAVRRRVEGRWGGTVVVWREGRRPPAGASGTSIRHAGLERRDHRSLPYPEGIGGLDARAPGCARPAMRVSRLSVRGGADAPRRRSARRGPRAGSSHGRRSPPGPC